MHTKREFCSPEQQALCPLKRHVINTHHKFFPAYAYQTPLEREFRELPVNKERICTYQHNLIHALDPIPPKPGVDEMIKAVMRANE